MSCQKEQRLCLHRITATVITWLNSCQLRIQSFCEDAEAVHNAFESWQFVCLMKWSTSCGRTVCLDKEHCVRQSMTWNSCGWVRKAYKPFAKKYEMKFWMIAAAIDPRFNSLPPSLHPSCPHLCSSWSVWVAWCSQMLTIIFSWQQAWSWHDQQKSTANTTRDFILNHHFTMQILASGLGLLGSLESLGLHIVTSFHSAKKTARFGCCSSLVTLQIPVCMNICHRFRTLWSSVRAHSCSSLSSDAMPQAKFFVSDTIIMPWNQAIAMQFKRQQLWYAKTMAYLKQASKAEPVKRIAH